jgi:hypothetical protein
MQTDFHFYAVYAICRLSGFSAMDAKTAAYASQYTDDAVDGRTIHFDNGGSFNPVLTAHRTLSFANFTLEVQKKIHLSFHFIPSLAGSGADRRAFLTQPACRLAEELVDRALARKGEPDYLHSLGIALHSFADTFSHRDFSGLLGPENDAELVRAGGRGTVSRFLRRLWHHVMEFLLPAIGHGELMNLPDTPYAFYSYFNFFENREIRNIRNTERFLAAAGRIFMKLGGRAWEKHEPVFRSLFRYRGALEQRVARWERAVRENAFGFSEGEADKTLKYDPLEWQNLAIRETAPGSGRLARENDIETSDFAKFHAAARAQRVHVLSALEKSGVKIRSAILKTLLFRINAFLSDLFRTQGRKSFTCRSARRAAFRFFIYGAMMMAGEVAFYTLVKIGRAMPCTFVNSLFHFQWLVDPGLGLDAVWRAPVRALYGQASLWMFFVYGGIGLFGIEPMFKRIGHCHWMLRGITYMLVILFMECATGWMLRGITGYDIWYYADRYAIFKYTSWAIAPLWFITGLLSENFVNFVNKYNEKKSLLKSLGVNMAED